jgi:hypothetical protein
MPRPAFSLRGFEGVQAMRCAKRLAPVVAVIVAGCTVAPPTGPTVMALPAQGKTLAQFQHDDASCRSYASLQTGGMSPAQAANQSGVNSAALGTLLGAAAGALLGAAAGNAAAGAAIGGGTGLAFGGLSGAGAAQASSRDLQRSYNMSYLQCMSASGESVPVPQTSASYPYPPPYAYGNSVPPPPPPVYQGP